ncbi:MAG: helicase DnaB, partial [Hamadaea sp.]|nr:helicase DnaB [Hamadaea sp.]
GRYFAEHALGAFDDMGADPVTEDARALLAWIEANQAARFTKRELFSGVHRGRFRKVGDLDPGLTLLETHGYIRAEAQPERSGPGRRPSPGYLAHPTVIANGTDATTATAAVNR